jgi:hypothetical protein
MRTMTWRHLGEYSRQCACGGSAIDSA